MTKNQTIPHIFRTLDSSLKSCNYKYVRTLRGDLSRPFGMQMHNRTATNESKAYRFGFQSQEGDDEIVGTGNSYAFRYRIHDARLGRFLSVDPLFLEYPYNSPYAFSENILISIVELEGLQGGSVSAPRYGSGNGASRLGQSYIKTQTKKLRERVNTTQANEAARHNSKAHRNRIREPEPAVPVSTNPGHDGGQSTSGSKPAGEGVLEIAIEVKEAVEKKSNNGGSTQYYTKEIVVGGNDITIVRVERYTGQVTGPSVSVRVTISDKTKQAELDKAQRTWETTHKNALASVSLPQPSKGDPLGIKDHQRYLLEKGVALRQFDLKWGKSPYQKIADKFDEYANENPEQITSEEKTEIIPTIRPGPISAY